MLPKKYFIKRIGFGLLLLLSIVILAACQSSNQNSEETTSEVQVPEIGYKYEQAEVDDFHGRQAINDTARYENITLNQNSYLTEPENLPQSLYYDSGINIPYPEDGVRGVYLTAANVADPEYFQEIVSYIDQTDLNAVVIDFKDDWGHIIPPNSSENSMVQQNTIEEVD